MDATSFMTKHKQTVIGAVLIVAPFVGLFVTLSLYAVTSFILASIMGAGGGDALETIGSIIRVLLGLVALVCMIGVPLGPIAGIILIVTANDKNKKQ